MRAWRLGSAAARAVARAVALAVVLAVVLAAGAPPAAAAPPAGVTDDPAGVSAIRFYQRHLSSLRHGRCRFQPSCSEYAAQAIRAYGLVDGTARAADRLMRCNAAAGRFYARLPDGRLVDPVRGDSPSPHPQRFPAWLLPDVPAMPPDPADATRLGEGRVAEVVSFAHALARQGDCGRATTEYLRAAHLGGSPALATWARARAGECRFREGEWAEAEDEFVAAGMTAATTRERAAARRMAAACRFNLGDFAAAGALAAASLDAGDPLLADALLPGGGVGNAGRGPSFPPDPARDRARALGTLGLAALARGEAGVAAARLGEAARVSDDAADSARFARLCAAAPEALRLPRRSPGVALALSAALPGAGQVYAGRAQDGFRHFLVNGALLYSVAKLVRDGHAPSAWLVAGLTTPFYLGNLTGARSSARAFNRSRRLEHLASAIERAAP